MELEAQPDRPPKPVTVLVNHQPVEMPSHRATGLQIKEAAIAQNVAIQLDFVLSRRVGSKHEIIGDDDEVELHEDEQFSAVAPDDNS